MVVGDLDVFRSRFGPPKADPVLVVDSNRMLASAISWSARSAGDLAFPRSAEPVALPMPGATSSNFRHLVRVQTRREVNLVNALRGYQPIEIAAPPELWLGQEFQV